MLANLLHKRNYEKFGKTNIDEKYKKSKKFKNNSKQD